MDDSKRTGDRRLPPGQYVTGKWPVLTYGDAPVFDPEIWRLRFYGEVVGETRFTLEEFRKLPRFRVAADFHCVTRFSTYDNRWEGVATRELLRRVRLAPDAAFVLVHCYGGYTTNLPLEDFASERALFADTHAGAPLAPEHGGPLRLVVPHLYAWKSAKWVKSVEFTSAEKRGFWEENGYHVYGDPWTEERFSDQEAREAYQVRRRAKELGLTPSDDD